MQYKDLLKKLFSFVQILIQQYQVDCLRFSHPKADFEFYSSWDLP